MPLTPPTRRTVLKGLAVAAGASAVTPASHTLASPTGTPRPVTIRSGELIVTVDLSFPAVLSYERVDGGATMRAQLTPVDTVQINAATHRPRVRAQAHADHVDYVLDVPAAATRFTVRISVKDSIVRWAVTGITDPRRRLTTFAVPGLTLATAGSDENGVLGDVHLVSQYGADQAEQFRPVAGLSADGSTQTTSYALLTTDTVAAAVYTTIVGDARLAYRTVPDGGARRTGLGPATWIYRAPNGDVIGLPSVSAAVTGDANADGVIDWQDAAIALRRIYEAPLGGDRTNKQVVQAAVQNIGSVASQPFLRTLDEIKRCYLLTDGLPQTIREVGYQSEGHDTAHPDYAGHYNERAGGLADLRTLVLHARDYNASVGLHINGFVQYPEAHNFRWDHGLSGDARARTTTYDQSWLLDLDADEGRDRFRDRLSLLHRDIPELGFIYSDAFRVGGLPSWEMAHAVNSYGWPVYTEYKPFGEAYSPTTDVGQKGTGFDSKILRFVSNSTRDVWQYDPNLLLGATYQSYQGNSGERDMHVWLSNTFTRNLPTKYMQNFEILAWGEHEVRFTGNLDASDASGHFQLRQDGNLLADGPTVFLPWDPQRPDRIYHWNDTGGTTTWTLPTAWRTRSSMQLYRLTDTGRALVGTVPVVAGAVTITADARVPYVLYPGAAPRQREVVFGAETLVRDPSFNSRTLAQWTPAKASGIEIATSNYGLPYLHITTTSAQSVSQTVRGLRAGATYSASVWVRVTGRRRAALRVDGAARGPQEVYTEASPVTNTVTTARWEGTTFQRMKVLFTAPGSGRVTLTLAAAPGTGGTAVDFADVRLVRNDGADAHRGGHFFTEDFEHVDEGHGPFVYAGTGALHTHLSELHQGYTRDTISGRFSLKSRDNGGGLVYRTMPQTLRFAPHHAYRVRFDYQCDPGAVYQFVVGADGVDGYLVEHPLPSTSVRLLDASPRRDAPVPRGWTDNRPPQYSAPHQSHELTFTTNTNTDCWLGVVRTAGHVLVLDNLIVDDLGPTSAAAGAPVSVTMVPAVLPPRGSARFAVTLTNSGDTPVRDLDVTLSTPDGWRLTGPARFAADLAPGQTTSATLTLVAPHAAGGEVFPVVRCLAAFRLGSARCSTSSEVSVQVPFARIDDAFTQGGIARDEHPLESDFDGGTNSFSAQALTAAGAGPRSRITDGTAVFTMPDYGRGGLDNACGNAATVALSGRGSAVAVLGATLSGGAVPMTLHYTDGTTSTVTLDLPAWTAGETPADGAHAVVVTTYQNTQYGPAGQGDHFDLYSQHVPADPTRTLFAVTLPVNAGTHVFALALVP